MKRVLFIVVMAVSAITMVGPAFAQRTTEQPKYLRIPHRFQIFLEGGGAIPRKPGDFKEFWNSSFSFGIGAGVSVLPWLEVNGGFQHMSFSNDGLKAKSTLRYTGIKDVQGGTISTNVMYGSARFLAVPKSRTNPYVEMAVGYYKTTAEDIQIEDVLRNSMNDASGMTIAPSVGIQYALSDSWSTYARYTYTRNLSSTFDPGQLLQPTTGTHESTPGDQVIQAITVGLIVGF